MIALVACSSQKLRDAAPAKDLYVSTLFKKSRAEAEKCGQWFVLSALHGLVHPDEILTPYDFKLTRVDLGWGWRVFQQLHERGLHLEEFLVFAGTKYVTPLTETGLKVKVPLKGLGIGQRLQLLSQTSPTSAPL